tara:strand:+ start:210 stop:503 length:294 start_codon:yes stop_codon:yes gene_type:complete
MLKRKIAINKKAKNWQDRYPLVSVEWFDICSDSSWQSPQSVMSATLPICITKGHLLSQTKGIIRIFGDMSKNDKGELEEVGNTTLIPWSVVKGIKKI